MTRAERRRLEKQKQYKTQPQEPQKPQEKTEQPYEFQKGIELCNRTACQSPKDVFYYNSSTRAWYCSKCARLINGVGPTDRTICEIDTDKQYYEEIKNQINIGYKDYRAKNKEFFEF